MMIGGDPGPVVVLDVTVAAAIAVVEAVEAVEEEISAAVDDNKLLVLMSCVLEIKLDSAKLEETATLDDTVTVLNIAAVVELNDEEDAPADDAESVADVDD